MRRLSLKFQNLRLVLFARNLNLLSNFEFRIASHFEDIMDMMNKPQFGSVIFAKHVDVHNPLHGK